MGAQEGWVSSISYMGNVPAAQAVFSSAIFRRQTTSRLVGHTCHTTFFKVSRWRSTNERTMALLIEMISGIIRFRQALTF
jgi:hypothetical protein